MDAVPTSRRPPNRRVLSLVVVPLIAMVVASNAAFFIWASIVDRYPLLLITLSAQNRYLALTTNQLDAWSYYLVGGLRLLAPDPLFYLLGYWYGARAIAWMERRTPSLGTSVRLLEQLFVKFRHVAVFVAPNNPVCLLAGAAAMPVAVFAALNVSGTLTRLWLIRTLGDVFDRPLGSVLDLVSDYRWYIVALSGVALLLSLWSNRSRGGGSEIEALRHLEDDLDGGEERPGRPDGSDADADR